MTKLIPIGKSPAGDPVVYATDQWVVCEDGSIESRQCSYWAPKESILDLRGDLYDWPMHMSEKEWVEIDQFIACWVVAARIVGELDEHRFQQTKQLVARGR